MTPEHADLESAVRVTLKELAARLAAVTAMCALVDARVPS